MITSDNAIYLYYITFAVSVECLANSDQQARARRPKKWRKRLKIVLVVHQARLK